MDPNLPFNFREVQKLTNFGINPDLFKLGSVTFESQKYICIKDQAVSALPLTLVDQDCAIIDTQNNFNLERKPMKAEGILMHRSQNIIALRAVQGPKTVIQVFNLETKQKLKQTELTDSVRLWKWIADDELAFVCKQSVYHTSINNDTAPTKMFDLEQKFGNCQIMNYGVDPSKKWCFVNGIYKGANNDICAHMQLYNFERKQHQILAGFSAVFTEMPVGEDSSFKNNLLMFCERKEGEQAQRLHIMEIGDPQAGQQKHRKQSDIQIQQEGDFPVLMHDCPKYGVLFVITKFGFLYMYEASTASLLARQRITDQLCFVSARNDNTDGMIVINRAGQILSVNVQEQALIPCINNAAHIPNNKELSFKLARRFQLPGADELFVVLFNQKLTTGDYAGAAQVARDAPGTLLRNQDTINKFKTLPQTSGPAPILVYFNALLQTTKLNAIESIELAKPVIQQNRLNLIETWIKDGKLTMTDELGDLIRAANPTLALNVYQQSGNPEKVIQGFIETNQLDKIMPFCQQSGHLPDFIKILRQIMPINPQACTNLAQMICNRENGSPKADAGAVADVFIEFGKIPECTQFLVKVLGQNRQDEGHLQTRLFVMNLQSQPNVADALFNMNTFTHYDRIAVAQMCEQAGLFGRALQNYMSPADIKRVILNVAMIPEDQIMDVFGKFNEEDSLQCMYDMLKSNPQNEQIVAKIAVKYASKIDQKKSIEVLESFGSQQGMLIFLTNVLPQTEDPDIYFKYIEACAKLGNFTEIDRVIQETTFYDPVKVKDYLMESRIQDPRPLIHLCDKHDMVQELTRYLLNNNQKRFIEIYLLRVNANATPKVLGTLLEMNVDEVYLTQLLNTIRQCPIQELVDEFETKGKLKMLRPWLESRRDERVQEPSLHNGLAKIYIESNSDPEKFLIENQFYDSKVIGKYCEERNPDLAFTAYKRAWGECDMELIAVTNKNFLFRKQARYLVERQNENLWATVLDEENEHRVKVIDQVIQQALPESKNPDEVSCTVKAFMTAGIQEKLIELLERIVLHNNQFSDNKNLQNLLILTAIKSKMPQLKDYIQRLNNYDGLELAAKAQDDQYQLYEEALTIYKKFNEHQEAVKILLNKMHKIKEAHDFAEKVNTTDVWFLLGDAYLDQQSTKECIDCYLKAKNPSKYNLVIASAQQTDCYEALIPYLIMARQTIRDQVVDNEIIFAYAKCGEKYTSDLEYFISEPNQANIQDVGDRCYQAKLFHPARILYQKYGNHQSLASTYVRLGEYNLAYEAARKADVPRVWKSVCFACVRSKEFNYASLCGLPVVILPDHMDDLVQEYEKFGYYKELIILLEKAMLHERSHGGIYTELAIQFVKHEPGRVMDFIKGKAKHIQIPKLIHVCEKYQMWKEVVQLNISYDQPDQAIKTMIQHSPSCFDHQIFTDTLCNVANDNLLYDSILFYLEEEPMNLNAMLIRVMNKLDLSRTVETMQRTGHINLIEKFLKEVQAQNVAAVNETLNKIYLEKKDYESLRHSIETFDNFESADLAQQLEHDDLLDCRRVSSVLYRKNEKYEKSLQVAMKDSLYKEAMLTVAQSKNKELADNLMKDILEKEDKELFAAMLFTCYELIKPDVALELAWRYDLMEFVMPYFIQYVKDLSNKVENVQQSTEHMKRADEKKKKDQLNQGVDPGLDPMMMAGMGMNMGAPQQLAIMGGPPMGGMGAPMGGMGAPMGGMGAPMSGMGAPMGGMPPMNNNMGGF